MCLSDAFVNSQEWTLSRSVPELKVVSLNLSHFNLFYELNKTTSPGSSFEKLKKNAPCVSFDLTKGVELDKGQLS